MAATAQQAAVRLARLGPGGVRLSQLMTLRIDLFDRETIRALTLRLPVEVRPPAQALTLIAAELGQTLDAILLVFIFVELLYAVRITLKQRQIVAEPFLIAGILVCIKEIVVLAVKAPTDYLEKGPEFARAMVEVGLLGVLVLVLAGTTVLLRKKEKEPEENAGTDSASEGG